MSQVPLLSLSTPSQHPVVALVDGTGSVVPSSYVGSAGATEASNALRVTGAKAATFPRAGTVFTPQSYLSSGRLGMTAIPLIAGTVITSISYMSSTTALASGTNQWFALYDSSRNLLRQTVNDGATAWAGSTVKTLALTSTFTVTYTGLHYLGIMVEATTVPTLMGVTGLTAINALAPILNGSSTTGLTTTAPNPAAGIASLGATPWGYVS